MSKDYFTVEDVSDILNLHVKTVRRFLREGRLKGKKIGRAWRIPADGLKAYAHGELYSQDRSGSSGMDERAGHIGVSAVVEFYERSSGDASRYSNSLIAMLNVKDPAWGKTRYDFIYHPEEGKARFVLYGSPRFISEVMKFFQIIQEQE